MGILQLPALRSFLTGEHPAAEISQFPSAKVKVKVKITLRLVVYHQSIRLGAKPLKNHDQRLFSQLRPCGNGLYVTSSLTRKWVGLL
jgi:hypothetical protein